MNAGDSNARLKKYKRGGWGLREERVACLRERKREKEREREGLEKDKESERDILVGRSIREDDSGHCCQWAII